MHVAAFAVAVALFVVVLLADALADGSLDVGQLLELLRSIAPFYPRLPL